MRVVGSGWEYPDATDLIPGGCTGKTVGFLPVPAPWWADCSSAGNVDVLLNYSILYAGGNNDQRGPGGEGETLPVEEIPRETYNDVIDRLTQDALQDATEELTDEDIRDIEEAIADIRAGRVYTTEELMRELGIG